MMTPQRYERLRQLFAATCELPAQEQTHYLDEACAGDPSLRAQVQALLAQDNELPQDGRSAMSAIRPFGEAARSETSATALPEEIGRYRIRAALGEGGMGVVYLADQTEPVRRKVALKILKRGMDTDDILRRFRNERQILASLEHPNIASLIDGGATEDGRLYLVMQYVQGLPIDEYCDGHKRSIDERLKLFSTVCEAVHFAHRNLVVHRDLKPANILITNDGVPKLLDFGIAKVLNLEVSARTIDVTVTELRLMTPRYASPEQVQGELITTASDVYSLGVILFELLTGRPPYELTTHRRLDVERIICEQSPRRPSTVVSGAFAAGEGEDAPSGHNALAIAADRSTDPKRLRRQLAGDLDTIVLMALRKEPERRYGSAEQLAHDLRRHLSRQPVIARPDTMGYRTAKFIRRNKGPVAAALSLFAMLVAGLVISTNLYLQADTARGRAQDAQQNATRRAVEATRAREEAEFREYVANIAAAQAALVVNDVATAKQRLEQAPDALRNWEWHHLHSQVDQSVRTFSMRLRRASSSPAVYNPRVSNTSYSPDGRLLAITFDGNLVIWDAVTGRRGVTLADRVAFVAWGPDSKSLVSTSGSTVRIWDVDLAREKQRFADVAPIRAVAVSPDGRWIATVGGPPHLKLWDAETGKQVHSYSGSTASLNAVDFSPDSTMIAAGSAAGIVRLWRVANEQEVGSFAGHTEEVSSVAFGPDGGRLASASKDGTVRVWDVGTGEQLLSVHAHRDWVRAVAFSPDGTMLATASHDRTVRLWNTLTGRQLRSFRGHANYVFCVDFSPDGTRLVSGAVDLTAKEWEIEAPEDVVTLAGHFGAADSVVFSPDGTILASRGRDATVRLWDAATGEPMATLLGHWVSCVAFSPDGSRLASGGRDGSVWLWDVETATPQVVQNTHVDGVCSVQFSPDGRRVASASQDKTVKIVNLATDEVVATLRGHTATVRAIAYSPDGRWLASGSYDRTVRIWDVTTGKEVRRLEGHRGRVNAVAFAPDGRTVASGSDDQTVRLWDVATGSQLGVLPGHSREVDGVTFHPNGNRLASCSRDSTIKIWDTKRNAEVATLRGHTSWASCVDFSPDGNQLAAGGSLHGTIRIWHSEPARLRAGQFRAAGVARVAAEPLVEELFAELRTTEAVVQAVEADDGLKTDVRQAALRLARSWAGRPGPMLEAAWEVVRRPGRSQAAYGQIYHRTWPMVHRSGLTDPRAYTTLGVAAYRLGRYSTALASLIPADQLNSAAADGPDPATIAFIAMTRHRLDQPDAASAALDRLRTLLQDPKHATSDARALLAEAEQLIGVSAKAEVSRAP